MSKVRFDIRRFDICMLKFTLLCLLIVWSCQFDVQSEKEISRKKAKVVCMTRLMRLPSNALI